jgi:hypothetical protein
MRIKDALNLRKGDRIVASPGQIETVKKGTTRDKTYPSVITIHTTEHDIMTTLPATVKVVNDE